MLPSNISMRSLPVLLLLLVLPMTTYGQELLPEPVPVVAEGYVLVRKTEARHRDDAWESTRRYTYGYDAQGQRLTTTNESVLTDGWRLSQYETCTHADHTRTCTKQERRGNRLFPLGNEISFLEEGVLKQRDLNGAGPGNRTVPLFRWEYAYDDAGRLAAETQYRWNGDTWMPGSRLVNLYDRAHRRYERQQQRMDDDDWVTVQRLRYRHDDAGREAGFTFEARADESDASKPIWQTALHVEYTFGPDGRISEKGTDAITEDGLRPNAKRVFRYDQAGNQTETLFYIYRDGDWIEARRETFEYARVGTPDSLPADPPDLEAGDVKDSTTAVPVVEEAPADEDEVTVLGAPIDGILFQNGDTLYRLFSNGQFVRSTIDPKQQPRFAHYVHAPNQRYSAFIPSHPTKYASGADLWLLDTHTGTTRQLTTVGHPATNQYAAVFADILGWTGGSRYLVYRIDYTRDPEAGNTTPPPDAQLGTYRYDLQTDQHLPIEMPGLWLSGLSDGRVLLADSVGAPTYPSIFCYDPATTQREDLALDDAFRVYEHPSRDTKAVAALTGNDTNRRMVVLETESGATRIEQLPPRFIGFSNVQPSPTGQHVAYDGNVDHKTHMLLAGGSPIYIGGPFRYGWIDDETLYVFSEGTVRIVKRGGKQVAEHAMGAE